MCPVIFLAHGQLRVVLGIEIPSDRRWLEEWNYPTT